jgi:hypothetical protein
MKIQTAALALMAAASLVMKAGAGTDAGQSVVIERVAEHLEAAYVFPEAGQAAAAALRGDAALERLADTASGPVFAAALTARLQALTDDGHLNVEYSADPIDLSAPVSEAFSDAELERYYGAHLNFGVEKVERLAGNLGYLDLRVFAPLEMGAETVSAAMTLLAHTEALIIDLRRNGGGMSDMADFVATYLFDECCQPLTGTYDRPTDTLTERYTLPDVPGTRFGPTKPVYVLTSSATFSAAEALAYNLQALERAVIVGEVTGGGAHPFEYKPVHPHFVLWSVTARSINPITGSNWQSVGVQPDIEVPAERALKAALDHYSKHADE